MGANGKAETTNLDTVIFEQDRENFPESLFPPINLPLEEPEEEDETPPHYRVDAKTAESLPLKTPVGTMSSDSQSESVGIVSEDADDAENTIDMAALSENQKMVAESQ